MNYILLTLFMSISFSQPKYPVDSMIKSTEITILKKIGLLPISIWQRISYNFNYFNCQFYPSCSNYCASAIKQYGQLKGMVILSERITRSNPLATYYHMYLKLNYAIKQLENLSKTESIFCLLLCFSRINIRYKQKPSEPSHQI